MGIEPTYATFEQSKWLKKKGFNEDCIRFYTMPNSKMFGIDEHGRYYPIKNKSKNLWITGDAVALNDKNVMLAPEHWRIIEWLRVDHGIFIGIDVINNLFKYKILKCEGIVSKTFGNEIKTSSFDFSSPQAAYSAAFDYIRNSNLI